MKRAAAAALLLVGCSSAPAPAPAPSPARPPSSPTGPAMEDLALPAAPSSLAPFLSVGPEGKLRACWLEPAAAGGHALRVATHHGGAWSSPVTAAEGEQLLANWADTPTIKDLGADALALTWPVRRPAGGHAYDLALAFSADGGASWSEPLLPHDDDTDTEHGFPALGPGDEGGVMLAWLDGRAYASEGHEGGQMSLRVARVTTGGRVEDERILDTRTCDCCPVAAAAGDEGLVVAYRDRSDGGEIRDISLARRTSEGWTEPSPLHEDGWEIAGCPVNGPSLDASGERLVAGWFTGAGGEAAAWAAFSRDGGAGFGERIRVDSGDTAGRVSVALLEEGAAVAWIEGERLMLRRLGEDGGAGPPLELAALPPGRGAGMPRLVRWGRGLAAAWTGAGEPGRVRIARVEPPPR